MKIHRLYTDAQGESHFATRKLSTSRRRRPDGSPSASQPRALFSGKCRRPMILTGIRRRAGSTSLTWIMG